MRQTVKGSEELIGKLRKLRTTEAKAAIRKGTRAGAKIVQAEAKSNAPVKSGALKQAVKVRSWPRSRRWTGTMINTSVTRGAVFYQSFIELGTKYIKARHFIRNAYERTKDQALNLTMAEMKSEIEQRMRK